MYDSVWKPFLSFFHQHLPQKYLYFKLSNGYSHNICQMLSNNCSKFAKQMSKYQIWHLQVIPGTMTCAVILGWIHIQLRIAAVGQSPSGYWMSTMVGHTWGPMRDKYGICTSFFNMEPEGRRPQPPLEQSISDFMSALMLINSIWLRVADPGSIPGTGNIFQLGFFKI